MKSVKYEIWGRILNKIGKARYQVSDKVKKQVNDELNYKVWDRICNKVKWGIEESME